MSCDVGAGEVRTRIEAITERYALASDASARLASLLDLVVSDPLAPTTVREPQKVFEDHLADSLVALELEAVRAATAVSDLGSGAGFPGLPLAIALPGARVWLVESNGRKCAFLERAVAACEVENVRVVRARAEAWPQGRESSDLVTARAVATLDVVAEYAAPLLRVGGALVVWRGKRDLEAENAGRRAAAILGLDVVQPTRVRPYPDVDHRHLHVLSKVRVTPERFPRRPGVARKRPLGAAATTSATTSDR